MRYEGDGNYLAFWGLLGCRIITICNWKWGSYQEWSREGRPLIPINKQKKDKADAQKDMGGIAHPKIDV
jgi:hypothetical protein